MNYPDDIGDAFGSDAIDVPRPRGAREPDDDTKKKIVNSVLARIPIEAKVADAGFGRVDDGRFGVVIRMKTKADVAIARKVVLTDPTGKWPVDFYAFEPTTWSEWVAYRDRKALAAKGQPVKPAKGRKRRA